MTNLRGDADVVLILGNSKIKCQRCAVVEVVTSAEVTITRADFAQKMQTYSLCKSCLGLMTELYFRSV